MQNLQKVQTQTIWSCGIILTLTVIELLILLWVYFRKIRHIKKKNFFFVTFGLGIISLIAIDICAVTSVIWVKAVPMEPLPPDTNIIERFSNKLGCFKAAIVFALFSLFIL